MAGEAVSRQKDKGTRFEQQVVDYLGWQLNDEEGTIERRALGGANDRGDVSGVRIRGRRAVLECKNCKRMDLAGWLDEAEVERGNDDADYAFVVHHRRGCGEKKMGETYVTCTLENLAALIAGGRRFLHSSYVEFEERVDAAREEIELRGIDHDG